MHVKHWEPCLALRAPKGLLSVIFYLYQWQKRTETAMQLLVIELAKSRSREGRAAQSSSAGVSLDVVIVTWWITDDSRLISIQYIFTDHISEWLNSSPGSNKYLQSDGQQNQFILITWDYPLGKSSFVTDSNPPQSHAWTLSQDGPGHIMTNSTLRYSAHYLREVFLIMKPLTWGGVLHQGCRESCPHLSIAGASSAPFFCTSLCSAISSVCAQMNIKSKIVSFFCYCFSYHSFIVEKSGFLLLTTTHKANPEFPDATWNLY